MAFTLIVLGCSGGPRENNLSGYLLGQQGSSQFIALDAGTLLAGISKAYDRGAFDDVELHPSRTLSAEGEIFVQHIKAYLISHAHLDHVSALLVNSQNDIPKPLLGIDQTIDHLREHLFNWKIWPNYGSEGENPHELYHYIRLPLNMQTRIPDTEFDVEPFLLSHHKGYPSSAFLIECHGEYVLYCGDTGPDSVEKGGHLAKMWDKIAPIIVEKKLKGMLLECSFPTHPPRETLYGHLNSTQMIEELGRLAKQVSPKHPLDALKGLKVVVTHMKADLCDPTDIRTDIHMELDKLNNLQVDFIYPTQGMRIEF